MSNRRTTGFSGGGGPGAAHCRRALACVAIFATTSVTLMWAFTSWFAGGHVDNHYWRVASPRADSLILGTSKGGTGIAPEAFDFPIINFAFSATESPFGDAYLRAIRHKLKKTAGGPFIIEVSPISLRSDLATDIGGRLDRLTFFSGHPNLNYLTRCYGKPLWKLVLPDAAPSNYLHRNGWLEVTEPARTGEELALWVDGRLEEWRRTFETMELDRGRLRALREIIRYCDARGPVLVVRLPVSSRMRGIETARFPEFDTLMESMCAREGVEYLSLFEYPADEFIYDEHHFLSEGAMRISGLIAEHVRKLRS